MQSLVNSFAGTVAVATLLAAFVGCDIVLGPALKGSGVVKTEARQVDDFTEIEVGNAIELDVTIGPETEIVLTGDDNLLPHLETEVSGERLKIYPDQNFSSNIGVKVSVTVPELRAFVGSGATRTTVTGVTGERFDLELSGASRCQLTGDLDAMDINLSGASHASLTGSAARLTLECSGASQLKAEEFKAAKVGAEISGASNAEVYATEDVSAEASGASHLNYFGNPPQVVEKTSGASSISRREK